MKRLLLLVFVSALLTGCGLQLSPVLAGFERGLDAGGAQVAGPEMEAAPGQAVLTWADQFLQPAYVPWTTLVPPSVRGSFPPSLTPDQIWINWWQLGDGSLVIQPQPGVADGLGLRVNRAGEVLGNKPWIDVRRGVRPSQQLWGTRTRAIFTPTRAQALDTFQNELVYLGAEDGVAQFEHRMRKLGATRESPTSLRRFSATDAVEFGGVVIDLTKLQGDRLHYRIVLP